MDPRVWPSSDGARTGENGAESAAARLVRASTNRMRTPLCPELRLHLIDPSGPLWRADEAELRSRGIADPFWGFAWPGGQALARYLLDRPGLVRGRRVLAFGAGSGIEAVAAARAGAQVWATDIDPLAVAACRLNGDENGVRMVATDEDVLGRLDLGADVVLAADVVYGLELGRTVSGWLQKLAHQGVLALLADPDRGFLPPMPLERLAILHAAADADPTGAERVATAVARVLPGDRRDRDPG